MKCPSCHEKNNKVLDTNVIGYGQMIKRRRECRSCQHRWTTLESEAATAEEVVKQAHKIIRAYDSFKKVMNDYD